MTVMKDLNEQKRLAGIGPRFEWTVSEQDDVDPDPEPDEPEVGGEEEIDEAADPADLAAELLDQGDKHMLFKHIDKLRADVDKSMARAKKELDGYRRIGAGTIDAPDLVMKVVLPDLQKYAAAATKVAETVKQVMGQKRR